MPSYRLIATRQNPDGSWEIPFIDIALTARTAIEAAEEAAQFPLEAFLERGPIAWLADDQGTVIRNLDVDLLRAA